MTDPGCPRGHVWVTTWGAKVSVCKNCGADDPVAELPWNDPLIVEERQRKKYADKLRARVSSETEK